MPPQDPQEMDHALEEHEGCRLTGTLDVQRVAGRFDVSVHVMDFIMLARTRTDMQARACSLRKPTRMR